MHIQLSDHFTYYKLFRFTLPSIVMMVFTSIYSIVDGFFVSNFVGKTPFAALNLIFPFLMICGALGFVFGTGGSALVAKTMGEGKSEEAKRLFSMLIYISTLLGIVVAVLGLIFLRPISIFLGAEGKLLENCIIYGQILLPAVPFFMLQNEFQSFLVTAEKPSFGLAITVAAGLTNVVLDALFIAVFQWGLAGAALATALSQTVGGLIPLVYFILPNKSPLRLTKLYFNSNALWKACLNGSSEFVSNISMSMVGMLYNFQLIKFAGEDGVAAYGVIMYVTFIFIAVFLGYSIGVAPVVGFHYGAGNTTELKNLLRKSMIIMGGFCISLTLLAEFLARPLSLIFVSYDQALLEMTCRGLMIYSISFLPTGFNIFGSSFFTALNDGPVSAAISFLRTLVFQTITVLALPALMPQALKLEGIWLSIVLAELLALAVTLFFLITKRRKYEYA